MPSIARTGQIRVVPNGSQREGEYAAVPKYSKIPEVAQPRGLHFFRRRQFAASIDAMRPAARACPSTLSFGAHGCSGVPGLGGGGGGGGGGTPR